MCLRQHPTALWLTAVRRRQYAVVQPLYSPQPTQKAEVKDSICQPALGGASSCNTYDLGYTYICKENKGLPLDGRGFLYKHSHSLSLFRTKGTVKPTILSSCFCNVAPPPAFTRWAFWIDGFGVGQCDERYWGRRVRTASRIIRKTSERVTDRSS